jgi:hypothetical protein
MSSILSFKCVGSILVHPRLISFFVLNFSSSWSLFRVNCEFTLTARCTGNNYTRYIFKRVVILPLQDMVATVVLDPAHPVPHATQIHVQVWYLKYPHIGFESFAFNDTLPNV